ncbi:MAG: trigger factor [Terriglobales bacterium]
MSTTETKDACVRELEVEIPADVVARETESVVEKFRKAARLPGFRKGKVPATIIRQRFESEVKGEVVETLVPRYFQQQVKRQKLEPVSQPRISDLRLEAGEPLRFKASFEVLPEIELQGYDKLHADPEEVKVTDEEVEQAVEHLRQQQATFVAVDDRALDDGDFAQVSFRGTPKEGSGQPASVEGILVEIGGENTVAEFSENLRGARAGEERSFDVHYPADFSDTRLAGKTISYTVNIQGVKQRTVPELNDDFAKELGEFQTLADLRARLRQQMESERKQHAEHVAKEKLVDQLVEAYDFPVPEALVERQIEVRLERGLRALAMQGMRADDMKKMDLGKLREGQREGARKEVKVSLLLEKIAEKEKIEVSDQEIGEEIEALAKHTQQTADSVRARLTRDGALDRIRNRIRSDKTLDFLFRQPASDGPDPQPKSPPSRAGKRVGR